jgi:hypothetical protein
MASIPFTPEFPDSPSVEERLNEVRAFNAKASLRNAKSLLDTGILLVLTAKRLDTDTNGRAKCLEGSKRCRLRVEEVVWKFQDDSEFSRLTADIDRLTCEISALG